jgi:hypothetical protein
VGGRGRSSGARAFGEGDVRWKDNLGWSGYTVRLQRGQSDSLFDCHRGVSVGRRRQRNVREKCKFALLVNFGVIL